MRKHDKRTAILEAAARSVALSGAAARTAQIARDAGVSNGTLFLYFSCKEELFEQLHQYLETHLRTALAKSYPAGESIEKQFRHVWESYIEWGNHANGQCRALRQLEIQHRPRPVDGKTALYSTLDGMADGYAASASHRALLMFLCQLMEATAALILEMIETEPGGAGDYKTLGWLAFWGAASTCLSIDTAN